MPNSRIMAALYSIRKYSLFYLGLTIITLIISNAPHPTSGTISVISEITNETLATVNDLPARFIPERFSFYGIQGYLIYSNPPDACTKVVPPPNIPVPNAEYPINWILLAKRSPDCHFQKKIENAQNAGYTAIIIHNVDSNSTEIMGVDDPSKIIIYATFVGEYDGRVLRNYTYSQYSLFNRSFIRIQDDFSINGYLLPFSIVVGLCFIVMIIFMVRLLWQQVLRCMRERRRSRRRKLPASALKKLPTQKWTKGDPYETCVVCLDDFVEQDKIRVLPCSHGFHSKCIDPWLTKQKKVCPICKRKVIFADERVERDSDSETDDETAPLLGASPAENVTAAAGEETFVQGEASSSQEAVPGQSQAQVLPQVHTRGRRSGFLGRARPERACSSSALTTAAPARVDSDSSSITSDSSHASGGSPSHYSQNHSVLAEVHHSTEVLRQRRDELEHNVNANKPQSQNENFNESHFFANEENGFVTNTSDNAVYVPDVEVQVEDAINSNSNPNLKFEDNFSSPVTVIHADTSSSSGADFASSSNQHPMV